MAGDKDRPQPRPAPAPDDPGKIGTEPVVREPNPPWEKRDRDDPGRLRRESIPFEEDRSRKRE